MVTNIEVGRTSNTTRIGVQPPFTDEERRLVGALLSDEAYYSANNHNTDRAFRCGVEELAGKEDSPYSEIILWIQKDDPMRKTIEIAENIAEILRQRGKEVLLDPEPQPMGLHRLGLFGHTVKLDDADRLEF